MSWPGMSKLKSEFQASVQSIVQMLSSVARSWCQILVSVVRSNEQEQ